MIFSIDSECYTKHDHGVIKFAKDVDIILEVSPLSIELADIAAQCYKNTSIDEYICFDINRILTKSQSVMGIFYTTIGIVSYDNGESCSIVTDDLSLNKNTTEQLSYGIVSFDNDSTDQ